MLAVATQIVVGSLLLRRLLDVRTTRVVSLTLRCPQLNRRAKDIEAKVMVMIGSISDISCSIFIGHAH